MANTLLEIRAGLLTHPYDSLLFKNLCAICGSFFF